MQIDLILQENLSPSLSLATDQYFLYRAPEKGTPVLRIYTLSDRPLSLGRFHAVPETLRQKEALCFRRLTGGRVVPCGEGFVALSLVLPHRSALLFDDPLALAPFQVMNRYVRGILRGLRQAGIQVFYPGRDFLTLEQKILGWISFVTEKNGALLFEALLCVQQDLSVLPHLLDQVDPEGYIPSPFLAPEATTSLAQETGRKLSFLQVARLLQEGYAQQFSLPINLRALAAEEKKAISRIEAEIFASGAWLCHRRLPANLPYEGTSPIELGVLTIRFDLTSGRLLHRVTFSGDFLAHAEALPALEEALEGCPAEKSAILLGAGSLEIIPETILKGLPPGE